jgi:hypothetical protein
VFGAPVGAALLKKIPLFAAVDVYRFHPSSCGTHVPRVTRAGDFRPFADERG